MPPNLLMSANGKVFQPFFFNGKKFWVSWPSFINTSIRPDFNWTLFIPKHNPQKYHNTLLKRFSKASQVLEKKKYSWLSYGLKYLYSSRGENYLWPSLGEIFLALPWPKILMALPWPQVFKAHPWSKVIMALTWPKILMVLQWPKILNYDKLGWQSEYSWNY